MTVHSPDNTPRYKVFYTSAGHQHVQQWRSHLSPSAFSTLMIDLWTAIEDRLLLATIDDVQWAPAGSNVFNSVTVPFAGTQYGTGAGDAGAAAGYIDFVGRGPDGTRVKATFYGINSAGTDWRFVAGESVPIDAAVTVLENAGADLRTVSDSTPVWKNYANAGYNAYWTKRLRP